MRTKKNRNKGLNLRQKPGTELSKLFMKRKLKLFSTSSGALALTFYTLKAVLGHHNSHSSECALTFFLRGSSG
jgi:hypothetical protein